MSSLPNHMIGISDLISKITLPMGIELPALQKMDNPLYLLIHSHLSNVTVLVDFFLVWLVTQSPFHNSHIYIVCIILWGQCV